MGVATHTPVLLAACTHVVGLEKGKGAIAGPARGVLAKVFGKPREGVAAPRPVEAAGR